LPLEPGMGVAMLGEVEPGMLSLRPVFLVGSC
jgi:hypothetical protein